MKTMPILLAVFALSLFMASSSGAVVYKIDPDHSSITLNVTHLGIGTVQGRFEKFSGTFDFDPKDVAASKVEVNIDASSINTNQGFRDEHLRSSEFLEVGKYPAITFKSTGVTTAGPDGFRISGDLSLHGITHAVVFVAKYGGVTKDMDGKDRIAFAASADINRFEYGIVWNKMVGNSRLVGQGIQIFLNVEGVEQAKNPQ